MAAQRDSRKRKAHIELPADWATLTDEQKKQTSLGMADAIIAALADKPKGKK